MALLNYALTYNDVSSLLKALDGTSDYYKLVFTKDGHIITHGYDYTAVASTSRPGLVNKLVGGEKSEHYFLNGTNTWVTLTTSDLPIASSTTDINTNKIFNTLQIKDYVSKQISDGFLANDAMRYKGTIAKTPSGGFTTTTSKGVENSFPKTFYVGDTYRVIEEGNYISSSRDNYSKCSVGDLLIAIQDSGLDTSGKLNTDVYWTIIETNINGLVVHNINGKPYKFYTNNTLDSLTIFAPSAVGTRNLVLVSSGDTTKTPIWVNLDTIIAKDITSTALNAALKSVTLNHSNGLISVTVWGTTKTSDAPTTNDTWSLNIKGQAAKVANALSIKGLGLKMFEADTVATSYDGSKAISISLLKATTTTLGGVIIDTNHGIGLGLKKPTISISDGVIYLTKENISNALGFDPILASLVTKYDLIVGVEASSITSAETATNPYINLVGIDSNKERAVTGDVRVMGAGHTSVTAKNDVITVSSSWRDIKVNGTSIGGKALNIMPSSDICFKVDNPDTSDIYELSLGISWYNINTKGYETA